MSNAFTNVIEHCKHNPLDTLLLVLHAYAGDLIGMRRSNGDPQTHKEISFDRAKVRAN